MLEEVIVVEPCRGGIAGEGSCAQLGWNVGIR
jgi:hypothetical protein